MSESISSTNHSSIAANLLIEDLLEIIGKQSNQRFGPTAKRQLAYFNRPSERSTFPIHLYVSRWEEKKLRLVRKDPNNAEKISQNGDNPANGIYSKKAFRGVVGADKVVFGRTRMTESETRAVGVLFMLNLVWATLLEKRKISNDIRETTANLAATLKSGIDLFSLLDDSDKWVAYSDGGKSGDKKRDDTEALAIIEQLVKANPELDTKILVRRILNKMTETLAEDDVPCQRWIAAKITGLKKILHRK